ncbi:hypothetical protein BpHYR1_050865 [Brachionus plicatilis]|uniref:Uncharacterized protein n=1 Tax=Brachionus plicatilis TaxID=10195 RepID=A0A3M7QX48_BRAPC|nr:hypothetical protein BpHYR1_050865 [Brachionus plicatilis]
MRTDKSLGVSDNTSPVGSFRSIFSIRSLFGFMTRFEFDLYSYCRRLAASSAILFSLSKNGHCFY